MTKKCSYESKLQMHTMPFDAIGFFFHVNGDRGFTMRILFSRKLGAGQKNTDIFTRSLLF